MVLSLLVAVMVSAAKQRDVLKTMRLRFYSRDGLKRAKFSGSLWLE
jgi:hypothetical protein